MFSLLLVIIYLSFISLGLPDSLLGSACPIMYQQFDVPVSYMGFVSIIISLEIINAVGSIFKTSSFNFAYSLLFNTHSTANWL